MGRETEAEADSVSTSNAHRSEGELLMCILTSLYGAMSLKTCAAVRSSNCISLCAAAVVAVVIVLVPDAVAGDAAVDAAASEWTEADGREMTEETSSTK